MKRIFSILLIAAMLLSLPVMPLPANATEENLCTCGCGRAEEDIQWKPWTVNDTGAPADGHYYLEGNYAQNAQHTIMAGDRVVIDLRGKTLTTKNYGRLFLVYGYLAVMDSIGGGRMCSKTSGAAFGGVVMVGMNETADPTFALHSGTLTVDPDNKSSRNGGLISVGGGCHFKMYGGTLLGGRTTERGGAIYANNIRSNVEILGGSILDCSADLAGGTIFSYGTTTLKNCRISGGEAGLTGGNLHQEGGVLTIENAVIEHGISRATSNGGGNIFALGSGQVNIKNSTIRGGYAANQGGNLCFGASTQILENVEVYGGVAANKGANIFGAYASTVTTIKGGEIAGDVAYANGKLTLQGDVKIGMNAGALKLSSGMLIDASGLTDGAEIYVDAQGTFTQNGADADYFKGAFRTALSENGGQLVATQADSGYCPHCGENVTWTAVSGTPAGHCYLTANVNLSAPYSISSATVLDLRGYTISSSDRAFTVASGASLALLDSVGGATVKGSGNSENPAGGVIYNAGTLQLYGGNYVYVAGKTVTTGGVVHTDGNMTVHGGILDGSAFQNTNEGAMGAALCVGAGERSFAMTAGCVLGGKTHKGGTACFGNNNTLNITGGTFLGGTATYSGGSIRLDGSSGNGNAVFSGVAIKKGNAETSSAFGGNISVNYCTVTITDCLLTAGNAGNYGGNISLGTRAYLTAKDSVFYQGSSPKGGNVYGASYLSGADFTDCVITGGKAGTGSGGNIMLNNGSINFNGGEISYGTAATGGNIYTNGGSYNNAQADDDGFRLWASQKGAPIVTSGTATGNGGNIYSTGYLVLDAAFIQNGRANNGKDIYYGKGGTDRFSLTVGSGLTGQMSIAIPAALIGGTEIVNATGVPFPGKLILEGDYGQPALTVKDGKLVIGGIAVIRPDGQVDWFAEVTDAVENCPAGGYVKLFGDAQATVQTDCYIDLNGKTLTISGSGTVYGMDSSGDDYSVGTGKLIPGAGIRTELRTNAPNGKTYIAIAEGDAVTYHRLGNELTDVTLRTSNCGIYYKGVWGCDSVLGERISNYGVAVSLRHMPGADFETDRTCLWAQYDGAELQNGEKASGVAITNIMKDSLAVATNARRGEMKVYASAYVKLTDGTVLVSDQPGTADDVAYSLHSAMDRLDSLISENPTLFRRYTKNARAFYLQWKEKGMNDWSFTNLEQPEEDDVIDVLMIGSSFCYYYVEELHALAAAAGIKMRVCNVYYSGCRLDQHYNWWIGNESKYQFFVTDENGRRQFNNVSLEYCLAQGNWDVISLQESSSSMRTSGAQGHFANTKIYTDALIPYLQSEFPDADVYWHQTWAYQVGYDRNGYQMTSAEQQERDMNVNRDFALLVCQEYGIGRINSGEAWQIIRRGGYDNLCARLAVNNGEGDYYHEGDIGGGQYLNGCLWFEILTGLSCVGNPYVPDYALDPALIPTLQNAAHQAAQALQE